MSASYAMPISSNARLTQLKTVLPQRSGAGVPAADECERNTGLAVRVHRTIKLCLRKLLENPKALQTTQSPHDWYIDGRIVEHIDTLPDRVDDAMVNLLPAGKERLVYAYDGYLWTDGSF